MSKGAEIAIASVVAIPVCYGLYCMFANDRATVLILRKEGSINKMLEPCGMVMLELPASSKDASPSEIQFAVVSRDQVDHYPPVGLPSRLMFKYLQRVKKGKMDAAELHRICLHRVVDYRAAQRRRKTL